MEEHVEPSAIDRAVSHTTRQGGAHERYLQSSFSRSLDFSGKTVLVVGGSSGIGNAIAQAFHQCGANVYVWGTRASAEHYSGRTDSNLTGLHFERVDVSDPDEIESYQPGFDRLDVLVLSQGLVLYQRQEFELSGFAKVMNVNLMSLMACATRFHRLLSQARGSLIIVGSSAAFHATRGNPAYNASKSGALGLTRTLAQAWAADGIRVNAIAPGFVATKLTSVMTEDPKRRAAAEARIPLRRLGTSNEMAGVVLFLASPLSSYLLGQTILVDGGMLL